MQVLIEKKPIPSNFVKIPALSEIFNNEVFTTEFYFNFYFAHFYLILPHLPIGTPRLDVFES